MPIPHPIIIHSLPGRLRLYIPALLRNDDLANRLQIHLRQQKGILYCTTNQSSGRALLQYTPSLYTPQQLCHIVLSYLQQSTLRRLSPVKSPKTFKPEDLSIPVQATLVLAGFLILACHLYCCLRRQRVMYCGLERSTNFVTMVSAIPVLRSGLEHLVKFGKLNNDILITAATLLSLLLREGTTGLVVIWLVNLSTLIETLTLDRSRRTIRGMLEGAEKNAWLLVNGQEVSIPLANLKVGDTVIVRIGSKVPVDGTIVQGVGLVNQAALTGESTPVLKQAGDSALAGSAVEQGTLYVKAEKIGNDTSVAQIIHLVETASHTRAPIQNIADQYAAKIIPVSFLLAAVVFLITKDIRRTMTILIVACPCAAGLSTPTALSAAIGNAASRGILIKGGRYLEDAGRLNVLLFDKTGTLTKGRPDVTHIIPLHQQHTAHSILALAATAESNANHPLARAIILAAKKAGIPLQHQPNSEMTIGRGVRAVIDHKNVYVGNAKYITDLGISVASDAVASLHLVEPTATVLYVAQDTDLIGAIFLADSLRPQAYRALQHIRTEGILDLGLVTGDTQSTAENIAHQLGISRVWSNMMPQDKYDLIKALRKKGYIVGMVGDGINDAPALAHAQVGIAMGAGGTDAAIETAAIVLREDNPEKIAEVIHLSKYTLTIIQQNFLVAIGANIIGLGLGSMRLICPLWAAVLHNVSTLGVVLNSTRLLSYNPTRKPAEDSAGLSRK